MAEMSAERRKALSDRMKKINADKRKKAEEEEEMLGTTIDWKDDKVEIKIAKTKGTPDPVFVGINGNTFAIKPGHWVSVPRAVLQVLYDSVINTFRPAPDPNDPDKTINEPEDIDRFAISTRELRG